jgi:NAD+ kinase
VRGASGRVVEIETAVNGHRVHVARCDGVIVATATGSTAYALSAGGPVISPEVGCMLVVAVAPHALNTRPLVIGPHDVVELRMPDSLRRGACVQVDGYVTPCRQEIESVTISRCSADALLVRLDGRDFFEVVRQEFLGG